MIREAVRHCMNYFPGVEFYIFGQEAWTKDARTSGTSVIRRSDRNKNGQVDARSVVQHVCDARDAELGLYHVIVFTGQDLNVSGFNVNFCFGARIDDIIVQSLKRFRILSEQDEEKCVLRILRHELGHLYGAAAGKNLNHPQRIFQAHCSNPACSMRQTLDVGDVLRMAREEDPRRPFCKECEADIARVLNLSTLFS